MTTPHAFILARIAEDEQAAQSVRPHEHLSRRDSSDLKSAERGAYVTISVTSSRILAQCAALRAVVDAHEGWHVCPYSKDGGRNRGYTDYGDGSGDEWEEVCPTLLALTAIWSTHADYDEGWAR